jgi:hypothetical protein
MTAIIIQPQFVALGTWRMADGKQVPVTITTEWRRPLEQLAQFVNRLGTSISGDSVADIAALAADVEALEVAISTQYATRYDQDDADAPTVAYLGNAEPGASAAASVWRIQRLTFSEDGDVIVQWADGNAEFDNSWNARASLSYS